MKSKEAVKSITIGSFDGIHRAHQELISKVDAVVVIERGTGYLTPGSRRCDYIDKPCWFYYFEDISTMSPAQFVDKLLTDFTNLELIVVGFDFFFGKGKSGDATTLAQLFKGKVDIVKEITIDGVAIHSLEIKQLLRSGSILQANKLLGRTYSIHGKRIDGQGLGSKQLMPTINIESGNYQLPKDGVYTTEINISGKWHKSVTFVGHRHSTDGKYSIETHIIDKQIKYVDEEVEIRLLSHIRDNQKFSTLDDLKKQILQDIEIAKNYKAENER